MVWLQPASLSSQQGRPMNPVSEPLEPTRRTKHPSPNSRTQGAAQPASCAPRRSRGARLLSRAVNYPKEKHLHPHRDDMTPCQWSRKLNLQMQNFLFPCRGLTPNARPTTTPKGGSLPTFFRPARLCLNVIISD